MSMCKKAFGLLILFFVPCLLFAELSSNPNHEIYDHIDSWYEKGYFSRPLPPLRPYPEQVLSELLSSIMKRGSKADKEMAERYLHYLRPLINWELKLTHLSNGRISYNGGKQSNKYYGNVSFLAAIEGYINPLVGYSAQAGLFFYNANTPHPLTYSFARNPYDVVSDQTRFAGDLTALFQVDSAVSLGVSNLYFQSGVHRRSMSPFWNDGLVLSSQAPSSPGLNIYWAGSKIAYASTLLILEAQNRPGSEVSRKDPSKFFFLQMLSFYPFPWFELGVYESVVWGERFDIKYLLPFKIAFQLQNYGGFPDNTFIGIYSKFNVARSLQFQANLYIDDLGLNDFLSFQFDTKYKLSAQLGASWSLSSSWFSRLSFDYTLVTDYMYTHAEKGVGSNPADEAVNFQNYTHLGETLGVSLHPNSHRIGLNARLSPLRNFTLWVNLGFIQHGNASEGVKDLDSNQQNDGTIWDSGFVNNDETERPTFQHDSRFLSQDVLETRFLGSLEARYRLRASRQLELTVGAEYQIESVINEAFKKDQTELSHYLNLTVQLTFLPAKRYNVSSFEEYQKFREKRN